MRYLWRTLTTSCAPLPTPKNMADFLELMQICPAWKFLPRLNHSLIPMLAKVVFGGNSTLCAVGLGRLHPGFCLGIFISGQVWLVLLLWFYLFSEWRCAVSSAPNAVPGCSLPMTRSVLSLWMLLFQIKAVFHGENQQHYGESRRIMKSDGIT